MTQFSTKSSFQLSKLVSCFTIGVALVAVFLNTVTSSSVPSYAGPFVTEVDSFNDSVLSRPDRVSFTLFYGKGCKTCPKARDLFSKLSKEMYGQALFASVDITDADNAPIATRFDISLDNEPLKPLIRAIIPPYPHSSKTGDEVSWKNGEEISLDGFDLRSLREQLQERILRGVSVTQLTSKNSKKILNDRKKPKALLFTTKKELTPALASLARSVSHGATVVQIPKSEKKIVKRFEVSSFPSFVVVPTPAEGEKLSSVEPVAFQGSLKASAMRAFAQRYFSDEIPLFSDPEDSLPRISDDGCFKAHCSSLGGVCVMVILPEQSAKESQYQLELIASVEKTLDEPSLHLSWISGESQRKFLADNFGLNAESYPQVVMLQPRKKLYANFIGAYTAQALTPWLRSIAQSKVSTSPIVKDTSDDSFGIISESGDDAAESLCAADLRRQEKSAKRLASANSSSNRSQSSSSSSSSSNDSSSSTSPPFSTGTVDWNAPRRPQGKRGEVIEALSEFSAGVFQPYIRNKPFVIRFVNENDNEKTENQTDAEIEAGDSNLTAFETAAKSLNSMVNFYTVSCSSDSEQLRQLLPDIAEGSCATAIYGYYPLSFSFQGTSEASDAAIVRRNTARLFVGDEVDSDALVSFATSFLGEVGHETPAGFDSMEAATGLITPVNGASFQQWLMTNILSPRVIFFSRKSDPLLARAVALEFQDFLAVGVAGQDESLMKQFGLTQFPAVIFVVPTVVPVAPEKLQPGQAGTHSVEMKVTVVPNFLMHFNGIAKMLDGVVKTRFSPENTPQVNFQNQPPRNDGKDEL